MGRLFFTIVAFLACAVATCAEEVPLHQRIDRLMADREVGPVADQCDDATFLRRASLALIGRIPTRSEVDLFLAATATNKRQLCVDLLLKSDDFPRHMAVTFELMLMERRSGSHVKTADFRTYLEDAFRAKKSYLDIVCEVLSADGTTEKNRAASAFMLQRDVEPHLLTRDAGRVLFGMDVQCAQCHDHPLIDDYRQDDYYGLNAFFVRSSLFQPNKKKPALVSETAAGEATFKSVFTDREGNLRPRIPGGVELTEAKLKPNERYQIAPAKNVRSVPVESRLSKLAATLKSTPSAQFDRNIVNRLWAHMFGRGLVHPVDLHHSANPPTHPEVLEVLAAEFRTHKHDVPWLLREIALTKTWQRSFRMPEIDEVSFAAVREGEAPAEPQIPPAEARQEPRPPGVASATSLANIVARVQQLAETREQQASEFDSKYETLLEQVDKTVTEAKPTFDAELAAMKKIEVAMKPRLAVKTKFDAAKAKADKSQKLLVALKESATKAAAAAKLLGDDSLSKSVATLNDRAAKQEAGLPKLQSALEAEQKRLDAADAKVAEASSAADPMIAASQPIDEQIRKLRREAYEQRLKAQSLRTQATADSNRADELRTILNLSASIDSINKLLAAAVSGNTSIAELRQQLQAANDGVTAAKTRQEQMSVAMDGGRQRFEKSETTLKALNRQQQEIEAAIQAVSKAAAGLPELTEIGEALSSLQAVAVSTAEKSNTQKQTVADAKQQFESAQAAEAAAQQAVAAAVRKWNDLTTQLTVTQETLTELRQKLTKLQSDRVQQEDSIREQSLNRFAAARLTALTPEQLAWSILIATGQFERQKASSAAKLNKEKPLSDEAKNDPAALKQREVEIEAAARKALEGTVNKFAGLYAASAGQPQDQFFVTAEQSLFLANGGEIRGWLNPSGGNLIDRANKLEDPNQIATELYLSILSRTPSAEETTDVADYLKNTSDKKLVAVQELAWGLLTSAEFRFQH